MTDEETSSDTLKERTEEAPNRAPDAAAFYQDLSHDAIEYAAQLEAELRKARAKVGRLLPLLESVNHHGLHTTHKDHPLRDRARELEEEILEVLEEMDRGDTVDRIRREAFEEAETVVYGVCNHNGVVSEPCDDCYRIGQNIRGLAEGDDQENDDDA